MHADVYDDFDSDVCAFQEPVSRPIRHPRAGWLATERDRLVGLSCCLIRASVLSESGQVATWLDETIAPLASRLEHPLTNFEADLATGDHIVGLHSASQVTVAHTSSGHVYWW